LYSYFHLVTSFNPTARTERLYNPAKESSVAAINEIREPGGYPHAQAP